MSNYSQRVKVNILPLSVGNMFPEAFEEWSFTEEIHDHETAEETCELCDQEQFRYHFKIKNELIHEK